MTTYRSSTATLATSLQRALRDGDAAELEHAAHSLKSSSAYLGATRLAELCQEMETLGRQKIIEDGSPVLAKIEAELKRVESALEETSQSQAS